MEKFRYYSLISALCLILGESYFVVTTNKYAPLYFDDYLIASCLLLVTTRLHKSPAYPALLLGCWGFIFGNLYAMLFTRLEPLNTPGRPWKLLAVLVIWSGLSTFIALRQLHRKPD